MIKKHFLLSILISFCSTLSAQYIRPNNFSKPNVALGISTGIGGLHSFLAPSVELKLNNFLLRYCYSNNSQGLGIGYEFKKEIGFKFLENFRYLMNMNLQLRDEKHSYLAIEAYYKSRWDTPWFIYDVRSFILKPDIVDAYTLGLLFGSRTYYKSNFMLAVKFGAVYLNTEKLITKHENNIVLRKTQLLSPYGELSLCVYLFTKKGES